MAAHRYPPLSFDPGNPAFPASRFPLAVRQAIHGKYEAARIVISSSLSIFADDHVPPGEQIIGYDRYSERLLDTPDPNTNTEAIDWLVGDRIRLLGSQYVFHRNMNMFYVYVYTIRNAEPQYDGNLRFILAEFRQDVDGETWLLHSYMDMRGYLHHAILILLSLNWRQFNVPLTTFRFKKSPNFDLEELIDNLRIRIISIVMNMIASESEAVAEVVNNVLSSSIQPILQSQSNQQHHQAPPAAGRS